ncbi:hypothetical protein NUITMVR1_09700 [Raoultella ornithinolytica]|nr:hypothetical protein NUITMVR1_09700 [Raoultella ornithinolytica]
MAGGIYGVVSITAAGAAEAFHPLPLHLLVTLLLHPDSRQTGCLKQQAGYYAIRMSRSLAVRGGRKGWR